MHARRGVLPEHYALFGKSMVNTLTAGLKTSYKPPVHKSWLKFISMASKAMISDFQENPDILSDDLSIHKIKILQDTWKIVNQNKLVGRLIFLRLFEIHPEAEYYFSFTVDKDYQTNPKF